MKHLLISFFILLLMLLSSCSQNSHIPNTSILEEITVQKLSDILKAEEDKAPNRVKFEDAYPNIRMIVKQMSEIDKAKVADLTYREFMDALDVMQDTIAEKQAHDEWLKIYNSYEPEAIRLASQKTQNLQQLLISAGLLYIIVEDYKVSDFIRGTNFANYMKTVPSRIADIDDSWDLIRIIKYDIAPNFDSEFDYCWKKKLERIEDDFPEAYYFIRLSDSM